MRLSEWQRQMEAYLLDDRTEPNAALRASLVGSSALSVDEGLAIYHNAYRARLVQALAEDYPAVSARLGEAFEGMARDYLRVCPSRHYSLRWLGERLPAFIEQRGDQALAELARLEWAFTLAFDAAQGEPLTLADMAAMPANDWPGLRVHLQPSVQWLGCRYNSVEAWRSHKEGSGLPGSRTLDEINHCLIWRQGLISRYRSLEEGEAEALKGMAVDGLCFAELCTVLSERNENAALQAAVWLKRWVGEGLLARVSDRADDR